MQQKQIGFRQHDPLGHEEVNAEISFCGWWEKPDAATNAGYGYRLTLHLADDPLARAYTEAGDPGHWAVFEPRRVRGLPAVVRSLTSKDDQCSVVVDAGDGQGIEVNGTITAGDPALCDRFLKAAGWVVDAARR